MFITNDAFRSPISSLLGNPGEHYWAAAELSLCQPWFLVTFRHTESSKGDKSFEITRTLLLSNVKDIEGWVQNEAGALRLEAVELITPGHLNGTNGWKMEPLRAVWYAQEPAAAGQAVDIYETQAGRKYARSLLDTPIEQLQNETLRFRLSAQKTRRDPCPH